MSDEQATALPGVPPPKLVAIHARLTAEAQARLVELVLDTSHTAEWLAHVLSDEHGSISATSLRTYRRALRRAGSGIL